MGLNLFFYSLSSPGQATSPLSCLPSSTSFPLTMALPPGRLDWQHPIEKLTSLFLTYPLFFSPHNIHQDLKLYNIYESVCSLSLLDDLFIAESHTPRSRTAHRRGSANTGHGNEWMNGWMNDEWITHGIKAVTRVPPGQHKHEWDKVLSPQRRTQ